MYLVFGLYHNKKQVKTGKNYFKYWLDKVHIILFSTITHVLSTYFELGQINWEKIKKN